MPGWDKAKEDQQYHRYRIRDPGLFKKGTLRTTDFKGKLPEGVKITRGQLTANDKWAAQNIMFDKDNFDLEQAKKWYAAHKDQFVEMLFEFADKEDSDGKRHESEVDPQKAKINLKEVQVFRAGKYPQGDFTTKNLDEMVANFNLKQHSPPVTIDHRQEGSAMGWVKRIWRKGTFLYAELHECTKEFIDLLREGKFKKISVEIWRNYEGTGKMVLKAVSFLGSGTPQVKGMKSPVRHSIEDVHGAIHFIASDDADNTEEDVDMTKEEMQALFTANNATILEAVDKKLTEFKTESADIKKKLEEKEATFAEKEKAEQKVSFEKELSDLVQAGKMLPAWKEKIEKMAEDGVPYEKLSAMCELFSKDMPKVVDVSELTKLKAADKEAEGMTETEMQVAKQLKLSPKDYKEGDAEITFGDIVHAAPKVE